MRRWRSDRQLWGYLPKQEAKADDTDTWFDNS